MADEIDYVVHGASLQYVEITLDPAETVIAEAGTMLYLDEDIEFESKMGDGSGGLFGSVMSAAKRMITSESIFMTHFSNGGRERARLAFAAPHPGEIIPVDLATHGEEIICQKDAFLCAARGTKLSIAFSKRLGAGLFGGEGFILQRLEGDGLVFMHAGGSIVERELHGETLRVDTGCVVGFESSIDYDVQLAGGLKSMLFGGEGLFLVTLSGHGKIWLQSMPFARLADRVLENARHIQRQGEK